MKYLGKKQSLLLSPRPGVSPRSAGGLPVAVALQKGEAAGEAAENAAELEATRQVLTSLSRKKRQADDDEDDFELSTADQVSFALSSLGTLLGESQRLFIYCRLLGCMQVRSRAGLCR